MMPTNRVAKITKANVRKFLDTAAPGQRLSEEASPLSLKKTAKSAQWLVVKKLDGRTRTFTPKAADGTVIQDTVRVWTPEQARKWAIGVVGDIAQGRDPVPTKAAKPTVPTFRGGGRGAPSLDFHVES